MEIQKGGLQDDVKRENSDFPGNILSSFNAIASGGFNPLKLVPC